MATRATRQGGEVRVPVEHDQAVSGLRTQLQRVEMITFALHAATRYRHHDGIRQRQSALAHGIAQAVQMRLRAVVTRRVRGRGTVAQGHEVVGRHHQRVRLQRRAVGSHHRAQPVHIGRLGGRH